MRNTSSDARQHRDRGGVLHRSGAQLGRSHCHRRRAHVVTAILEAFLILRCCPTAMVACRPPQAACETIAPARPIRSTCWSVPTIMEKSAVAAEFAEMVDEGLRAFNVERIYGGEMKVERRSSTPRTRCR